MAMLDRVRDWLLAPPRKGSQVAVIGTAGAGKTTFISTLDLYCTDLSNEDANYKYFLSEFGMTGGRYVGIKIAQSRLKRGFYPDKTPSGQAYEAIAQMKWRQYRTFTDNLDMPFIEMSGEDIQKLLERFGKDMYTRSVTKLSPQDADLLGNKILDSDGFILVCPVTRALAIDRTLGDEWEPKTVSEDPDVNAMRLIQCILKYKEEVRASRPLKQIYILLTKSDVLLDRLKVAGMDLETEYGIREFMTSYYSNTWGTLDFFDITPKCFPFFVWAIRDQNTGLPLNFNTTGQGDPEYRVQINPKTLRPYYSNIWLKALLTELRRDFT